jgi:tetratricopeptide (TPR) repeat protein
MSKRKDAQQIRHFLRDVDREVARGLTILDVCHKYGVSVRTYYRWRLRYDPAMADDTRRAEELQAEVDQLKRLVAELMLDKRCCRTSQKKVVTATQQRAAADFLMATYQVSQRRPVAAHYNLGNTLAQYKKLPKAVAAYRKALDIDPRLVHAHAAMGRDLTKQGLFVEGTKALQRALALLGQGDPFRSVVLQELKRSTALLALDRRIPLVLQNKDPAAPPELLQMAVICQFMKKQSASAARLYEAAFKADPSLAEDARNLHRYNAACAAALAGAAQVPEDGKRSEKEAAAFREQARAWLSADLTRLGERLKNAAPLAILLVEQRLSHWQEDADLASVRDAGMLANLPAEEGKVWQKLWAYVAERLNEVRGRFTDMRVEHELTQKEKGRLHAWNMVAGRTNLLELESTAFDTLLKLQDPAGKQIAEYDDISAENLNSRLIFTPPADGVYRLVATSFEQAGAGPYTLRIREFKDVK